MTLEWTGPQEGPAITGYRITRQDPGTQARVLVENTASTGTAYTDSGLSAGLRYVYTVAALSADHASQESEPLSVWAPLPVLNPAAQADTDHIDVSWTAPEETGTLGYIVRRRDRVDHGGPRGITELRGRTGAKRPARLSPGPRYPLRLLGPVPERPGHRQRLGRDRNRHPDDQARSAGRRDSGGRGRRHQGRLDPARREIPGRVPRISRRLQAPDEAAPGEWTVIQDGLAADAVSHTDMDAAPTVRHAYRVQAYNAGGDGPWSDEASAVYIPAPTIPGSVSAEVSGTGVTVSWTAPEDSHHDGHDVRHRITGGEWEIIERLRASQGNSHTHEDAAPDVTHEYQVRSWNGAGESAWSETASAIRVNPPGMPADLAAAVSGTDIVLTWTAPAGLVSGYDLERRIQGAPEWTRESMDGTSFTHTGPGADVHHEYRVRTRNAAGESGWTDSVTARIVNPPGPPTGLEARADGPDILVSWTAPAAGIVDSYDLDHREQGGAWTTVSAAGASYRHRSPTGDIAHEYRARSRNEAGTSGWTAVATAMRINLPLTPTGLTARAGEENILVIWTAPPSGIVDGYDLRYRRQGGGDWTEVSQPGTSFTHPEPAVEVTYEYQVRSKNAAGPSGWTGSVMATRYTGPLPPERITYQKFPGTLLLVTWTASESPGTPSGREWTEGTGPRPNRPEPAGPSSPGTPAKTGFTSTRCGP